MGNFSIDLPAALNGFVSITLRGIDARDLPDPYVIADVDNVTFDSTVIKSEWELLTFEVGADTAPSDIIDFAVLEDTGIANNETSNPSVIGKVNPFELVEIVTRLKNDTTNLYEDVATERVVANSKGEFVFASQQFAEESATGKDYEIIARTVSSDLTTFGTDSIPVQFTYIAKGTSILAGFDTENEGLLTGTVTSEGNVAGLRVEIDVDLGSGFDDAPDGYAITGADGNFSYQLYGYTAGQLVKARTRVIQWDPVDKKFTEPEFQTDDNHSANDEFTPSTDSVNDPSLDDNVTEGLDAFDRAKFAVENAIREVLIGSSLSTLYSEHDQSLDLGVWTTGLLENKSGEDTGPDGVNDQQQINIASWQDVNSLQWSDPDQYDQSYTHLDQEYLPIFTAQIDATNAVVVDSNNNDVTLQTAISIDLSSFDFSIDLESNNSVESEELEVELGAPRFEIIFSANGVKNGDEFVVEDYSVTETFTYGFHTVDESYDDNGFLLSRTTRTGTTTTTNLVTDSPISSLGLNSTPFNYSETVELQTWVEEYGPGQVSSQETDPDISPDFDSYSYYWEESTNVGDIEVTGTTGKETVNAEGYYTSTRDQSNVVDVVYNSNDYLDGTETLVENFSLYWELNLLQRV